MSRSNPAFERGSRISEICLPDDPEYENEVENKPNWDLSSPHWSKQAMRAAERINAGNEPENAKQNGFSHKPSHAEHAKTTYERKTAEKLFSKQHEYEDDFTTHGCKKLWRGSLIEKIFWGLLLLAALAVLIYSLYNAVTKYYDRSVFNQVWDVRVDAVTFPAVTFCIDRNDIFANKLCGGSAPDLSASTCNQSLNKNPPTLEVLTCELNGKSCLSGFRNNTGLLHTCVTFNSLGNHAQTLPGIEHGVAITINDSHYGGDNKMRISIHNFTVSSLATTSHYSLIYPGSNTYIKISRDDFSRLPKPYRSACVSTAGSDLSFIPDQYTSESCSATELIQDMFKACGSVFDKFDRLLPDDFRSQYQNNMTIAEKRQCLDRHVQEIKNNRQPGKASKPCPRPCEETLYPTRVYTAPSTNGIRNIASGKLNSHYFIHIYYRSLEYTVHEEMPDYDLSAVIADFGGLLGLLLGASIMTIPEVIIYVLLVVARRCHRK